MSASVETKVTPFPVDPAADAGAENSARGAPPPNPAAVAFTAIPLLLSEIKAYVSHFMSAKTDQLKLTARNIAIYAALGLLGLIVFAGVIITAVGLILSGLAHGLGNLLWHQLWLGDLVLGLFVLGTTSLGIYIPLSRLFKTSRKQTELKYEGKRIQERVQHGRDIRDRASEHKPRAK